MITRAKAEHWPQIRRICVATSYVPVEDPAAFAEKWVGPYQRAPELSYVALVEGKVAGYLTGAADHFHINVDPEFQGCGLGRRLVERFLRDCPSEQVHVVCREEPVPFYEALGFKLLERRNNLYVMGLARRRNQR